MLPVAGCLANGKLRIFSGKADTRIVRRNRAESPPSGRKNIPWRLTNAARSVYSRWMSCGYTYSSIAR